MAKQPKEGAVKNELTAWMVGLFIAGFFCPLLWIPSAILLVALLFSK